MLVVYFRKKYFVLTYQNSAGWTSEVIIKIVYERCLVLLIMKLIYITGTCPLLLDNSSFSVVSYTIFSSGRITVFLSFGSQFQVIDCGTSGQWNDTALNTYTRTTFETTKSNNYEHM